jgi:hypothetical protein
MMLGFLAKCCLQGPGSVHQNTFGTVRTRCMQHELAFMQAAAACPCCSTPERRVPISKKGAVQKGCLRLWTQLACRQHAMPAGLSPKVLHALHAVLSSSGDCAPACSRTAGHQRACMQWVG